MKITRFATVAACAALLAGCATPFPVGSLYTEVNLPSGATGERAGSKVGTAQCMSVLGLVATGDASIAAAMRNGGITKVSHVDWHAKNILGIIGTYTTVVYGE